MKGISTQNIKAFAKRFGYQRKGGKGIVSISAEQAMQAINNFVKLNGDTNLKPSFIETRIRLLKICLEEKTAYNRWVSCREYLLKRLESQVLGKYITEGDLPDEEVKPPHLMSNSMDPSSFLSQCIKSVVLFNITDDDVNLSDDILIDFGSGIQFSFPEHQIKHQVIILKALTKTGVTLERGVPASKDNLSNLFGDLINSKCISKYSYLSDQDSRVHVIQGDKFFDSIQKSHPEISKASKLHSAMKPSTLFSAFNREVQQKIIKQYTGSEISQWKWELENKAVIDFSKVVKEYYSDVNDKIISIRPYYPIKWKPDNYLFDEDSLRSELVDLFLKTFPLLEREEMLSEYIVDISIFNLKTFRDLLQKWQNDKEFGKISSVLSKINSNYYESTKDTKERGKIIEYVKITTLIQQRMKCMIAYELASPSEKVNTVEKRYLRQKNQLQKSGYEVDSPDHISVLMKDWDISEFEINFNY